MVPVSSTSRGTDTCIKLGGYLRVDTTFNGGIYDSPAWNGDIGSIIGMPTISLLVPVWR
jgi:hypothetical protein